MPDEYAEAKREITELIKKYRDRDDSFIDGSLQNLAQAVDSCLPHAAEIAVRVGHLIDHQKSVSELYLALGDQPEEEHRKVLEKTNQQKEKLDYIVKEFIKTCKCMHNT